MIVDDGKTSRNRMQIGTLLHVIEEEGFTAAFGGGRRDEEKARAKERVYSHRDEFGQWDPKMQRPELWSLYNGQIHGGEHMRIFPLSNWTELDVWDYIHREEIEIPSIYFSHQRRVILRDGMLLSESETVQPKGSETVEEMTVRFRTVGDMTQTGCVESTASTTAEIIEEIAIARVTERGATRGDDRFSEAAMEDRKEGRWRYFVMDLLRFATAGSVDDGKSTLIGRLLLDSKAIFEDQLEAVESTVARPRGTTTPTSPC